MSPSNVKTEAYSSPLEDSSRSSPPGDVSVDRITSFHGKLNRFLLTSNTADISADVRPSPSTLEGLDTSAGTDTSTASRNVLDHLSVTKTRSRTRTTAPIVAAASPIRPKGERSSTAHLTSSRSPIAQTNRITRSRSSSSIPQSSPSPSNVSPRRTRTPRSRKPKPPPTQTPTAADSLLQDTIPPNLTLLLVGVNPGILTGTTGFAYAHPSNLYWKLLRSSGITSVRHPPSDTYKLPALYNVGNTNIVERPSRDASMLTKAEMDAGVPVLEAKVAAQRPEAVCLVGKGIWEAVWRVRHGRALRKEEFRYGWQDVQENMGCTADSDWKGAPVFVTTTTSGLAAGMSMAEKEAIWAELGAWVVKRRAETGFEPVGPADPDR
ncbi:Uncharacterized protein PECH_006011 [Penicillium ucsense]|uniref:Uracil-DNA glycosylase-like domain-containing protein n=1 Tax=Penicillium ucsense TaxID=2839758 RepID=A0A8J8W1W8_9EURO|nr:Uncharacterized protein PECM_006502 [Penicillium ucsense]KAF7735973.1 Uncharacterized protein PECH_006011 [Penicillium ucsense]